MSLHLPNKLKWLALLLVAVAALAVWVAPSVWAGTAENNKHDCKRSTVPCKEADLAINKNAKHVSKSDDFIFTITVKNHSKIVAEKVVVTDELSPRFQIVSLKGPGCKAVGRTITCSVGNLGANKSTEIVVRVDVEPDKFRGKISNTATVSSSTKDPNSKNNSSTVTVNYTGDK